MVEQAWQGRVVRIGVVVFALTALTTLVVCAQNREQTREDARVQSAPTEVAPAPAPAPRKPANELVTIPIGQPTQPRANTANAPAGSAKPKPVDREVYFSTSKAMAAPEFLLQDPAEPADASDSDAKAEAKDGR